MKLAIGCDHGGFELKEEIVKFLKTLPNVEIQDFGVSGKDSVDYPDYGRKVSEAVSKGVVDRGILICGTGIGMSIVANRYPGCVPRSATTILRRDEPGAQRRECAGHGRARDRQGCGARDCEDLA